MAIISKVCCDECGAVITSENGGYLIIGTIKVAPVGKDGNYLPSMKGELIGSSDIENIEENLFCTPCLLIALNLEEYFNVQKN